MSDATAQHAIVINEIRYAERLCQRTARMYRRAQTLGTFGTVLAGGSAMAASAAQLPAWVGPLGAVLFAAFGAALLAIRPADKAAANEVDARRYAKLRTEVLGCDATTAAALLAKARESDAAEVEPLRDVAYNDTVIEAGRPDLVIPLRINQRMLAALA